MKILNTLFKTLLQRMCVAVGAAALFSGIPNVVYATQTVRELWDGTGKNALVGHGSDSSSMGLDNSTTWVVSPPGNTTLTWDSTWNIDGFGIDGNTALPPSDGSSGTFGYYSGGNMTSSLINPATSAAYGDYYSQCYALRKLDTNAYINFKADGTYYLSVRMFKNISWWGWNGDNAGGIGFASSSATNANFVGVGNTRNSFAMEDSTDASSTSYITTGTLDQAGVTSHPDDSGGVYYPRAAGAANLLGDVGIFLVGKLTTTASGASTLSVKAYPAWNSYPSDPSGVTWDATYSFTETNIMTQLLVWQYGTGPSVQDAIRVATTWGEAVGVEALGPVASPSSTVYAGTTVTLTATHAGLNTGTFPMTFQWSSNSVPLIDATNSTLVLSNTTTSFTAYYSVGASNAYGVCTVSTHVQVNPAVPPFFTAKPTSITRYLGSPTAKFTAFVDGTPPYTYQWKHAGTNIGSAPVTANQNTTLVLPPIALADVGDYSVTVENLFGSTNSGVATLNEIVPAAGSYAAAVTALNPYGYWRLDDASNTNNPAVINDFWGANQGVAVDSVNTNGTIVMGVNGAPFVGFPSPHQAVLIGARTWPSGDASRVNLNKLTNYTANMTYTMWINSDGGGCQMLNHNGWNAGYGIANNSGTLQFQWHGYDAVGNVTNITWGSGLSVPAKTWTFVALVVEPTQATFYVGADRFSFSSVASGPLATEVGPYTNSDSTTLGDSAGLYTLGIGRDQWPWAENESGPGSGWATMNSAWSDVAIFYQSLTPTQIKNLYLAGVGYQLQGAPDGAGNLVLKWLDAVGSVLQQADNVAGPYTDIGSATPPYSVAIPTVGNKFYRIKH